MVCRALTSEWVQEGTGSMELAQMWAIDYKINQSTEGRKGNDAY